MRYKAEYDEYSETNKFLDDLFREDCEFGWAAEAPQTATHNALNITVVKPEGHAEELYLHQLAEEMAQKLSEILDMADALPTEHDGGVYLTKDELVARMISISNSLDGLKNDIENASQTSNIAVIGGACPMTPMF